MRPLTALERERLERRVAQSLCWAKAMTVEREDHLYRARMIVKDLEAVAIHGATDKRAGETVIAAVIERTA